MKRKCNLLKSQLSFKDMRYFVIIGILYFFTTSLRAQDAAADPNAIDLTHLMQVIDSSTPAFGCYPNLNIGDIDGDGYEDMVFGRTSDSVDYYSLIHYGGARILSSSAGSIIYGLPSASMDFDGDGGRKDLITKVGDHQYLHKNFGSYPYFNKFSDSLFWMYSLQQVSTPIYGIVDYNGDGNQDLICGAGFITGSKYTSYFISYEAGKFKIAKDHGIYPNDSCGFPPEIIGGATPIVSQFGKNLKPMIVLAGSDTTLGHYRKRIGITKNEVPLSQDSFVWISNSDSNGVDAKNLYSMDITGDGIADLLVSDGVNIYVYNGNDNFGSNQLTKKNACYIIKSPAQLDLLYTLMTDFGGYMRCCGDLTGSGTPLLMVTGTVHNNVGDYITYAFFYSGGKALDTYYDAIYREYRQTNFTIDTLHSIDKSGRGAVVFQSGAASSTNFLIYKGCEDIPRTPNPNLKAVPSGTTETIMSADVYPSIAHSYVKVHLSSPNPEGELHILNILGQIIESRKILENDSQEIFINTTRYPNGMYTVEHDTPVGRGKTKFIVEH